MTSGHAEAASTCSSGCRDRESSSTSPLSTSTSDENSSRSAAGRSSSGTSADGALLQLSPQPSSTASVARTAPSPYAEGAPACARTVPFGSPKPRASCHTIDAAAGEPGSLQAASAQGRHSSRSGSGSSPLSTPAAAAPALSLPDLMDCLWSGAPLAAARVEEGGEDKGSSVL